MNTPNARLRDMLTGGASGAMRGLGDRRCLKAEVEPLGPRWGPVEVLRGSIQVQHRGPEMVDAGGRRSPRGGFLGREHQDDIRGAAGGVVGGIHRVIFLGWLVGLG